MNTTTTFPVQVKNFILHLRLHYQFLLLSGGYLLGGFLSGTMDTQQYLLQFLNVHILLFGGATAFNSYWDKDTGPIGGLKNPPKMNSWMRYVSILMMAAGQIWALYIGLIYAAVYFVSFLLFWLYSTPLARWKADPLLSLLAIGFSTGFNSVLLGTLAAGGVITGSILLSAAGATFILLSLYPVSQIYQVEEDRKRGDRTFALRFGVDGVKRFFAVSFISGLLLLTAGIFMHSPTAALLLLAGCVFTYVILLRIILKLKGDTFEYDLVMRTKFIASLSFVLFFIGANLIQHNWLIF